ncbi:uncharacterized protein [Diabrotica undecimpunctata]|uniref:uncharacterized protein n=1 Tax=Diabrotica undecimpunctata TaxID=50387 RepID=UPI003B63D2FD
MNQLSGKYVNVVLSVESGRGMDFLKNKVYITGNFNNRILESDHIPPEDSPPFNTELVWEIEKKELRRIRCGNIPLRVECITADFQNRKERIGFALLSLRSAQIIPQSLGPQPATPKWYKLIGCQADKRKSCPELFLSLSLRDNLINERLNIDNNGKMPFILEEEVQLHEDKTILAKDCPVKYFENGHIQIGDEKLATIAFTLNLKVMDVHNLDALLPEVLVFQANSGSFFLKFKILGIAIKTKPFQNQIHGKIGLNERIVVNLLSTKEILDEFFKFQSILVSFYCGYEKLGIAKFNVENIWEKTSEMHYFKIPSMDEIVPYGSSEKSPFIILEFWIKENPDFKKPEAESAVCKDDEEAIEKPKSKSIFSNINKMDEGQFDCKTPYNTEEPATVSKAGSVETIGLPIIIKSVETMVDSEGLSTSTLFSIFQKYVILVSLKYLVWTSPPKETKIMFKFLHPKASNCTTIFTELNSEANKEIVLNNFYVRMAYISTSDNIGKLLRYWQPKLILADENEEYISDKKTLDLKGLETSSSDFELEFQRAKTRTPMAKVGINITLNKVGNKLEGDYENLFLLPVILDEIIAVSEIYELEIWKEERKKRFEAELERLKREETFRLENQYQEKKQKLQVRLGKTMKKCQQLQDELKRKVLSLKFDKEFKSKQKETQSEKMFEDIYAKNSKCYSENNTKEVITLLSKIQRDNLLLTEICEEQKKQLSSQNKSTTTKAQTNALLHELKGLEEKFSEVRAAKYYFKEQMQNVSEDIHTRADDVDSLLESCNEIEIPDRDKCVL